MTGRAPTDGRVYGQPTYAAIARAHGALLRLQKTGLVRSERTPLRVVWFRAEAAEHTEDVADPGRVRYGAGMVDYGN